MKKELLVSSLLMLSPVQIINAADLIKPLHNVSLSDKEQLEAMKFESKNYMTKKIYVYDEKLERNVFIEQTFKLRLTFYKLCSENEKSCDEDFMRPIGVGEDKEYEVIVQKINKQGEEIGYTTDDGLYVKRLDDNSFRAYNCMSTMNCREESNNVKFHVFKTRTGKRVLKVNSQREAGYFDKFLDFEGQRVFFSL